MPDSTPATNQSPHDCCINEAIHCWSQGAWTETKVPVLSAGDFRTCLPPAALPNAPSVTVIQARAEDVKDHTRCLAHFQSELGMPDVWFSEYSRKSNGYFGCDTLTDSKGNIAAITTWCRFLIKVFEPPPNFLPAEPGKDYWWDKLNMFTKWEAESNKTTIIFFVRSALKRNELVTEKVVPQQYFRGLSTKLLEDPFWMYTFALGDIAAKQNTSVWKVRTMVREKEKEAENSEADPENLNAQRNLDYRPLHDLARHTIHGTETLDAALAVVELMVQEHASLKDIFPISSTDVPKKAAAVALVAHRKQHSSLLFHLSALRSLLHRSTSNKERLLNEINLVFNTVAQSDASTSHYLAAAARIDSAAMKTIAYVTTAFLPATFIAAIFSTSFFNFEQDKGWDVSGKFWIYWICAVPITIAAVISLRLWEKWFLEKGQGESIAKMACRIPDELAFTKAVVGSEDSKDAIHLKMRTEGPWDDPEIGRCGPVSGRQHKTMAI